MLDAPEPAAALLAIGTPVLAVLVAWRWRVARRLTAQIGYRPRVWSIFRNRRSAEPGHETWGSTTPEEQ